MLTPFRRLASFATVSSAVCWLMWACGGGGSGAGVDPDGGGIDPDSAASLDGGGSGSSLCSQTLHVDRSFGVNGVVTLADSAQRGTTRIAGSAAGVLRSFTTTTRDGLERLRADGTVDPLFDTSAVTTTTDGGLTRGSVFAVAPDGSVVIVWSAPTESVARLKPDGRLDTTFGQGGIATLPLDRGDASVGFQIARIVIGADGYVYVIGYVTVTFQSFPADIFVVRLDTKGAPDPSFGTGGAKVLELPLYNEAFGALPLADRRLLLGVYFEDQAVGAPSTYYSSLFRLTASGASDDTFGKPEAGVSLGKYYDDSRSEMYALGPGHVALGGLGDSIRKYTLEGVEDPTFGRDGSIPYSSRLDDDGEAVVLDQPFFVTTGGTIVALSRPTTNTAKVMWLSTYDANGASCSPRVELPFPFDYDDAARITLAPDGMLWVHQRTRDGAEHIARLAP